MSLGLREYAIHFHRLPLPRHPCVLQRLLEAANAKEVEVGNAAAAHREQDRIQAEGITHEAVAQGGGQLEYRARGV